MGLVRSVRVLIAWQQMSFMQSQRETTYSNGFVRRKPHCNLSESGRILLPLLNIVNQGPNIASARTRFFGCIFHDLLQFEKGPRHKIGGVGRIRPYQDLLFDCVFGVAIGLESFPPSVLRDSVVVRMLPGLPNIVEIRGRTEPSVASR